MMGLSILENLRLTNSKPERIHKMLKVSTTDDDFDNCGIEVPVLNSLIEDSKNQEMTFKGISKFETVDQEQILNFFT